MINPSQDEYTPPEDDFWSEHIQLFTAQFPTYYTKPQKVWGRFHISEEKFSASKHEIIPIKEQAGTRTYVMMQPYVLEPILTISVGLFDKPKRYADQDSPIGKTIGQPRQKGGIRLTRDSGIRPSLLKMPGRAIPGGLGFGNLKPLSYRVSRLTWIPQKGFQEAQAGNAQAWYYQSDKTIVLWECFF